ncbi:MAG: acyltransferase family protein [bacterium]
MERTLSNENPHLKTYRLVDAFKGLAILTIVCFHLLPSEHYGFIKNVIITYGFNGLPVFFVISGYGIAASTSNAAYHHQPYMFLLRRLKRIFFPYWWSLLIAALFIPFVHAVALTFKAHAFMLSSPYSLMEWIQVITLAKIFSATSWVLHLAFDPLNGPIWYVAIIVQIYIYVFICLYFKKYFSCLMFIGFIASLLTYVPVIKGILPYGLFLPYLAQVYVGFTVYSLLRRGFVPKRKLIIYPVSFFLLAFYCFCAFPQNEFFTLSFALIIGYVLLVMHKYDLTVERFLVVRLFSIMGAFSYSLYLLHFPLRILAGMFAKNLIPFLGDLTQPLAVIAIAITLSFIWYLFFEKPSSQINVLKCLASPINTIALGVNLARRAVFREGEVSQTQVGTRFAME